MSTKKVNAKFIHTDDEEKWLHGMLNEGWILTKYDSEEIDECQYQFERAENEEAKNLVYKIDYRTFNWKRDYLEYKSIFEDAGWTALSKNTFYSKHIFYTERTNKNIDIFSDSESYRDREKRKMNSYLQYIFISLVIFAVSFTIYLIYDRPSFMFAGLVMIITAGKSSIDYIKQRKIYQSYE
jgi:Protein of unknown function (DUF2812)